MGEARERVVFLGAVASLLAIAGVGYGVELGSTPQLPAPAPPEASPDARPPPLVIVAARGPSRIWRGGQVGFRDARAGESLLPDDVVETGADASVELEAGERYRVAIEESTRLAVRDLTDELSRFRLATGLVSASVGEDPARTVEVESGGAVAETHGGDVWVARAGEVATVSVLRGEATLRSAGRAVTIGPGEQAQATASDPPGDPVPIPSSLLLKVASRGPGSADEKRLVITGRAGPGALVAVEGRPVPVAADGTFRRVLYLRDGRDRIAFRTLTESPDGRRPARAGTAMPP